MRRIGADPEQQNENAGMLETAKRALEQLIPPGGLIRCEHRGRDRYGRSIGLCRVDGRDGGADW